jgi:DNA-binding HxlR family transcriptional regulator
VRWSEINQIKCSVARTLSVIGDRWTLLIVRDTFLGLRRFEDFQHDLRMTRHRLADRLRKLVADGILERVQYHDRPRRFEYRLTEKGIDLYPVVVALLRWGDRWMVDSDGPPIELVHRNCRSHVMPVLTCPACNEEVNARTMSARLGPGLRNRAEHPGYGRVEPRTEQSLP